MVRLLVAKWLIGCLGGWLVNYHHHHPTAPQSARLVNGCLLNGWLVNGWFVGW